MPTIRKIVPDIQGSAKEWSIGCVKCALAAREGQDAGFTQPRPHSLPDPFKSIFGGKEKIIQAAIFYEQSNGLYFYYRVKA